MPVFNNSDVLKKNIGYLTGFLSEKKYDYEIIIVDDGSKFASEIKFIADENKTGYIRIEKNTGKGEAIKVGMLRASGKYRVFTDADIPYEKESLSRVIEKLDKEEYDVVVGDRTCVKSSYFKNISFLRSFGSKLFDSSIISLHHQNGPAMYTTSSSATSFATFADNSTGYQGYSAIVGENYGSGRVLLSGSHPEIDPQDSQLLVKMILWATKKT